MYSFCQALFSPCISSYRPHFHNVFVLTGPIFTMYFFWQAPFSQCIPSDRPHFHEVFLLTGPIFVIHFFWQAPFSQGISSGRPHFQRAACGVRRLLFSVLLSFFFFFLFFFSFSLIETSNRAYSQGYFGLRVRHFSELGVQCFMQIRLRSELR